MNSPVKLENQRKLIDESVALNLELPKNTFVFKNTSDETPAHFRDWMMFSNANSARFTCVPQHNATPV
jgi:hypothetical protein